MCLYTRTATYFGLNRPHEAYDLLRPKHVVVVLDRILKVYYRAFHKTQQDDINKIKQFNLINSWGSPTVNIPLCWLESLHRSRKDLVFQQAHNLPREPHSIWSQIFVGSVFVPLHYQMETSCRWMHQPNLEYQFQLDGDEDWTSVPIWKRCYIQTTALQNFAYSKVSIHVSHESYGSKNRTEENRTWRELR